MKCSSCIFICQFSDSANLNILENHRKSLGNPFVSRKICAAVQSDRKMLSDTMFELGFKVSEDRVGHGRSRSITVIFIQFHCPLRLGFMMLHVYRMISEKVESGCFAHFRSICKSREIHIRGRMMTTRLRTRITKMKI